MIVIDQHIELVKQYCECFGIQVNSYRNGSIQHNESLDIMKTVVQPYTDALRILGRQRLPLAHLHGPPIKLRETNSDITNDTHP